MRCRSSPDNTISSLFIRTNEEIKKNLQLFTYRGDLGFCSEECRCQQILSDEQIETALKRKRLNLTHRHQQTKKSNIKQTCHHTKILLMA
jgi:zinc-finger of the FCS-type, C2-C2